MKITTKRSLKFLALMLAIGFAGTTLTSCDDDPVVVVENCTNGVDDDGDGSVDCADGDCATNAACTGVPTEELGGSIGTRELDPNTVYIIDRFAYVADGDVLTIPAGTILKAKTGDGADASALIIARGGEIIAIGEPDKPIIFTSVDDGIEPGETESTLDPLSDAGKWGGLVILGKAPISASVEDGDTETSVEGIPDVFAFSIYGGSMPDDNSGTLEYVSIRFTGTTLATNSEIQGLTLGGVGAGTTISDIEIVSSDDDGVECFGGTVDINNMLVVAQADDGIDIDQAYKGTIDNALVVTFNPSAGNDANELDGPEGPSNATGKYTISNTTYINKGSANRMATLKSGSQGTLINCSWRGYTNGIYVNGGSANANFASGMLSVEDCEFDFSGSLADLITSEDNTFAQDSVNNIIFAADGNAIVASGSWTKGSDADFSWTFAESEGLLD